MNRSSIIKILFVVFLLGHTNLDAMIRKSKRIASKKQAKTPESKPGSKKKDSKPKEGRVTPEQDKKTDWLDEALVLGTKPINFHTMLKSTIIPDVYYDEVLGFLRLKDQEKLFENKIKHGQIDPRKIERFDQYALVKEIWADKRVMVFYAVCVKADFAGECFMVPGVTVKGGIFVFQGHDEEILLNRKLFEKDFFEDAMGYCNFSWYVIAGQHGGVHLNSIHSDEKYEIKKLKKFILDKALMSLQDHGKKCFWVSTSYLSYSKNRHLFWDHFKWPRSVMQNYIFPQDADRLCIIPDKKS